MRQGGGRALGDGACIQGRAGMWVLEYAGKSSHVRGAFAAQGLGDIGVRGTGVRVAGKLRVPPVLQGRPAPVASAPPVHINQVELVAPAPALAAVLIHVQPASNPVQPAAAYVQQALPAFALNQQGPPVPQGRPALITPAPSVPPAMRINLVLPVALAPVAASGHPCSSTCNLR